MPTITTSLKQGQIAPLDRELILASVLKRDRTFILAHPEYEFSEVSWERFKKLVERREQAEPLAYILGEKEFYGLPFVVNRSTLIPRPETELLVEETLSIISNFVLHTSKQVAVVDVGTGSGCIIISVIKNLPSPVIRHPSSVSFFATDISEVALATATQNAVRHQVEDRVTFLRSDLLYNLSPLLRNYEELLILANLPYVSEELYRKTDQTVHDFEPRTALESGPDGLDHYRRLLIELAPLAREKKLSFLLEISPEQAIPISDLCQTYGANLDTIGPDLAGKARLVAGHF